MIEINNNYCPQCGTKQEESSLILVDDLKVNEYRNGDFIPKAISNGQWIEFGKAKIGAYSCILDKEYNVHYLYNWYAVNDERELAPEGWHIPTDEEWNNLENQLKENPTYAGYRCDNGNYYGIGHFGYFWSSTEIYSGNAWYRTLIYDTTSVNRYGLNKQSGFSVRCLKGEIK